MRLFSSDDDEFRRVHPRVCAACGATASCRRITTAHGLAKSYDFECSGCHHGFTTSGLFSLVLFSAVGLFMLVLAVPIATTTTGDHLHNLAGGLAAALFGAGALAFVGFRVRTARTNPEIRGIVEIKA